MSYSQSALPPPKSLLWQPRPTQRHAAIATARRREQSPAQVRCGSASSQQRTDAHHGVQVANSTGAGDAAAEHQRPPRQNHTYSNLAPPLRA